jgi:hypothetical protein
VRPEDGADASTGGGRPHDRPRGRDRRPLSRATLSPRDDGDAGPLAYAPSPAPSSASTNGSPPRQLRRGTPKAAPTAASDASVAVDPRATYPYAVAPHVVGNVRAVGLATSGRPGPDGKPRAWHGGQHTLVGRASGGAALPRLPTSTGGATTPIRCTGSGRDRRPDPAGSLSVTAPTSGSTPAAHSASDHMEDVSRRHICGLCRPSRDGRHVRGRS